jgi:N-acetylmuramoyl-L-alanine amidase
MLSAATFGRGLLLLAVLTSAGWSAEPASDSAPRLPPSRPALSAATPRKLAIRKFGTVEYVNLADVAAELGLKFSWLDRKRKAGLSGSGGKAEIEADTRDILINGLRVFLGEPAMDADGKLFVSRIDFERCLTPRLRPGYGVAPRPAPKVIVLDAGHGGRDNGTSVNEKVYALDVSRRAAKLLEAQGYKVLLTRNEDVFIELKERALLANTSKADVFVSIHFNALPNNNRTSGVEVYTFPPALQHATGWWGSLAKEDRDLETTEEPVNRFDHWNAVLAQQIHRRFIVDLKTFDRGQKLMHLGVLRGLNCPGLLVECGFLTSDQEARKIATPEYRQKLAEAVAEGVQDFAGLLKG